MLCMKISVSFIHQLPQLNQYGNTSELKMGYCMIHTNSSLVVSRCAYIPTLCSTDNWQLHINYDTGYDVTIMNNYDIGLECLPTL